MKNIKKNAIFKAILINVLIMCFFNVFFYAQSYVDDLAQFADISGLYTNVSDYHLQWGGLVLGKVLQFFCNILPGYNWYAINQYAVSFASLTIFSYLVLNKQWGNIEKYVLFVILFVCGYELYVTMGFTKTSGIVGAIAIFIVASEDASRILKLAGGALFWWSTQIRFTYFLMFAAGILFVETIKMIDNHKNKAYVVNVLKRIALLLIFFIIVFAENRMEGVLSGQNPIWKEYFQRNVYRAAVYDRNEIDSNYDEYMDEYLSLGITKSMVAMWKTNNPDFKYPDTGVFSEALNIGEKLNYENRSISKFFDIYKIDTFFKTDVLRNIKTDVWFAFFMIALFVSILSGANKKLIGMFSVSIVIFLAFEYYLYTNERWGKHRVDVSVAAFMVVVFLLLIDKIIVAPQKSEIGKPLMVTFLLYILLVYNNVPEDYNAATKNIQTQIEQNKLFYSQTNMDKDNVYFQLITDGKAGGGYFDVVLQQNAFEKIKPGYLKNIMFSFPTPIKDEVMRDEYGITDIWLDVIDNEKMYIVLPNDKLGNGMVDLTANYLSDRKGETVRLVKVKYYSDKNVYKAYTDSYQLTQPFFDDNSGQKSLVYQLEGNHSLESNGVKLTYDIKEFTIKLSGTIPADSDYAFQNNAYLRVTDKDTGETDFYDIFQNFGNAAIEKSYRIYLTQELPDYYSQDDELSLVLIK